jgi:hypothetical protein
MIDGQWTVVEGKEQETERSDHEISRLGTLRYINEVTCFEFLHDHTLI